MEGPVNVILTECVNFMISACEHPNVAYPISSLPYPKKWVKTILLDYVISFRNNHLDGSVSKAQELRTIKNMYLLLASFIDDTDAEFVNNIADSQALDETDIHKLAQSYRKYTATDDFKRNEAIRKEIRIEREDMEKEINEIVPMLASLNILHTV